MIKFFLVCSVVMLSLLQFAGAQQAPAIGLKEEKLSTYYKPHEDRVDQVPIGIQSDEDKTTLSNIFLAQNKVLKSQSEVIREQSERIDALEIRVSALEKLAKK